ncbi:MAG: aldo/keto reductase [Clostridia bacterium]|nr:aldo/keto reductase [Clostridia bacterium]
MAQVALQYVLSSPMNVFAIVSVSNENRMAENIQAAQSVMALNTWLSFRDF